MASYKYILRTSQALFSRDDVAEVVHECEALEKENKTLKEKETLLKEAEEVIQSALDEDVFCIFCGGREGHLSSCKGRQWIKKYYKLKNG